MTDDNLLQDGLAELQALIYRELDAAEERLLHSSGSPESSSVVFASIQQCAQETEASLRHTILRIRRRTNRLAPVNRIPPELLLRIFYESQSPASFHNLRISHVCAYWRELALDDARLWTSITIINGPALPAMPELLRRSKAHPVNLSVYLVDIKGREGHAATAIDCISKHMKHIRRLSIDFNADIIKIIFRKLCETKAPMLTCLNLSCTAFHSRYPLPGNLFSGDAPALVSLELSRISPANLGKAFTNIRNLKMWWSCVNVETLRRIASVCPNVEDVTLHGEGYPSARPPDVPGRALELHRLEQITFADISPDTVMAVIMHLDCSDMGCITIRSGETTRHVSHLSLVKRLLSSLGPITEVLIEGEPIRGSGVSSEPTRRAWRLVAFDKNDMAREIVFEDGISRLPHNSLNPSGDLLTHVRKFTVDARCWAPFIDSVDAKAPALGVLKIEVTGDNTEPGVWHLNAVLKPLLNAKQPLRCPGLRRLTLRSRKKVEVSAESVLQVLDQTIEIQSPKLKELKLKNISIKAGMGLEILRARVEDIIL